MVQKRRHLRKGLDHALKVLALINFMVLAMIADFDGWKGLIAVLALMATELILIGIISTWGRED